MTCSEYINSRGEWVYVVYDQQFRLILQTTSLKLAREYCDLGFLDTSKIPDTVYY